MSDGVRRAMWAVVAVVSLLVGAAPVSAAPPHQRVCVPVRATGVGQDLGGGMTTATIYSRGVRVGTTAGTFTVTGQVGDVASFSGPIVFTGLGGTLTAPVTGTLDLGTGAFASASRTVTGTGALGGVSGSVRLSGVEDLTTGAFTERISGRLCLPR